MIIHPDGRLEGSPEELSKYTELTKDIQPNTKPPYVFPGTSNPPIWPQVWCGGSSVSTEHGDKFMLFNSGELKIHPNTEGE